jgi:hypothetical protein
MFASSNCGNLLFQHCSIKCYLQPSACWVCCMDPVLLPWPFTPEQWEMISWPWPEHPSHPRSVSITPPFRLGEACVSCRDNKHQHISNWVRRLRRSCRGGGVGVWRKRGGSCGEWGGGAVRLSALWDRRSEERGGEHMDLTAHYLRGACWTGLYMCRCIDSLGG